MKLLIILYIVYAIPVVVGGIGCSSVIKPLDKVYDSYATNLGVFIFEKLADCASACLRVTSCAFVKYYSAIKLYFFYTGKHDVGRVAIPVEMNDWKQVMKADPCSNKPCGAGQRCLPNRSSYICEDYECLCCNIPYFMTNYNSYNVSSMHRDSPDNGLSLTDPRPSWLPESTDQNPHMVVSFIKIPFIVKAIATRGDQYRKCWTSQYTIETSGDCKSFTLLGNFEGNYDDETVVTANLNPPLIPKCLKLTIAAFKDYPCLKMDVIGCYYNI